MNAARESARDQARFLVIERLLLALVSGVLGLALLRATVPSVAFPGWDLDPSMLAGPVIGLGPTANLGIDLVMLTLAGAILALSATLGLCVRWWRWLLLGAGLATVAWHARFSPAAAQDHLTLGASWAAAMSACVALSVAARLESVARVAAALLLGSIAFFALKAGVQVLVENPQTIEMFKANRESMLAAQGWTPDSFAAKAFERRLYDAPGTGWLGLSNVLATAGACATAAAIAILIQEQSKRLGVLAAAAAGIAVLYFAGSKGGWGAAAMGIVALALLPLATRWRFGNVLLLVSLPLTALAAVGLRGLVGERIGELSLLFRSQYLGAAARIFAEHPLLGVGPAGFKDAYLLAKNPLNPEEITSPHSVFFDFAATLGIGGLAWSALLLSSLASAARAAAAQDSEPSRSIRAEVRFVLLTLSAATIAGAWVEIDISSPANVLVRIGGLALAAIIAIAVLQVRGSRVLRVAAAIAGAVGLTHGMIELTPVIAGSAPLFAGLIGLAGATRVWNGGAPPRGAMARALPGLALCVIGLVATLAVGPVSRWEALLRSSSASMGQGATLNRAFAEASDSTEKQAALSRLREAVGSPVGSNDSDISSALMQLRARGSAAALQELIAAIAVSPTHSETRESASRVALQLAAMRPPESQERRDLRQSAIQLAADATTLPLRRAAALAWLANVLRGAADLGGDPTLRREALSALERAASLDPWNPMHAANAAKLAAELRDDPAARRWAAKALELDTNMRLDPLRRLEPTERARLEALAKQP